MRAFDRRHGLIEPLRSNKGGHAGSKAAGIKGPVWVGLRHCAVLCTDGLFFTNCYKHYLLHRLDDDAAVSCENGTISTFWHLWRHSTLHGSKKWLPVVQENILEVIWQTGGKGAARIQSFLRTFENVSTTYGHLLKLSKEHKCTFSA